MAPRASLLGDAWWGVGMGGDGYGNGWGDLPECLSFLSQLDPSPSGPRDETHDLIRHELEELHHESVGEVRRGGGRGRGVVAGVWGLDVWR